MRPYLGRLSPNSTELCCHKTFILNSLPRLNRLFIVCVSGLDQVVLTAVFYAHY
jgi:hypothetical protein